MGITLKETTYSKIEVALPIDTAYGVYINIDGFKENIVKALVTYTKKTVEVGVRHDVQVEFFERLGFYE